MGVEMGNGLLVQVVTALCAIKQRRVSWGELLVANVKTIHLIEITLAQVLQYILLKMEDISPFCGATDATLF